MEVLTDPENVDLNVTEVCKKAGISRTMYYNYFAEPEFRQYVKDCSLGIYIRHLPQVANKVLATAKSAIKGNDKAQRLIHEACEIAGNKVTQQVNVGVSQERQAPDIQTPEELLSAIRSEKSVLTELERQLQAHVERPHAIHPRGEGDGG